MAAWLNSFWDSDSRKALQALPVAPIDSAHLTEETRFVMASSSMRSQQTKLFITVYLALAVWLGFLWAVFALGVDPSAGGPAWLQDAANFFIVEDQWWLAFLGFFALGGAFWLGLTVLENQGIISETFFADLKPSVRWVLLVPVMGLAVGLITSVMEAPLHPEPSEADNEFTQEDIPDAFANPLMMALGLGAAVLLGVLALMRNRRRRAEKDMKRRFELAREAFRPHLLEGLESIRDEVAAAADSESAHVALIEGFSEHFDAWNLVGIRGPSMAGRVRSALVDYAGFPDRLAEALIESAAMPGLDDERAAPFRREDTMNALTEIIALARSLAKVDTSLAQS